MDFILDTVSVALYCYCCCYSNMIFSRFVRVFWVNSIVYFMSQQKNTIKRSRTFSPHVAIKNHSRPAVPNLSYAYLNGATWEIVRSPQDNSNLQVFFIRRFVFFLLEERYWIKIEKPCSRLNWFRVRWVRQNRDLKAKKF